MNFQISVYQRKIDTELMWTTLGWGPDVQTIRGRQPLKIQRRLSEDLRRIIAMMPVARVEAIQSLRGLRLERVKLELVLKGGGRRKQVAGTFPLILDPRWTTDRHRIFIAYHPMRQHEWCPIREEEPIESQAALYFEKVWADLEDYDIAELTTKGKDLVKTFGFDADPPSVLDQLPAKKKGPWADLVIDPTRDRAKKKESRGLKVLPKVGTNQTLRAIDGSLHLGLPRSPYREQMARLVGSKEKKSVLLVGPPGSGKSTILARWVKDLTDLDDYPSTQNLDRIHDVWMVAGKRIIAGMSYLGDWEQRCLEIVEDTKQKRMVLWLEDVHAFGRIGQSKTSDRSLADFFRGPLSRGEMTAVAECTPEQLQRLEDDAPSFAALFTKIRVFPSSPEETLRILLHEARALEVAHDVWITPGAHRSTLELGTALHPSAALPGKAVQLERELAQKYPGTRDAPTELDASHVVSLLSTSTGLPDLLLSPSEPLSPESLSASFSSQVAGQPVAVEAAVDLVLRIRAGLVDPDRPFAVYLFTGPTGTGKTELAACIASYLYGSSTRLVRLDMGELGGPEAVPRLIGDRWEPDGLLTRRIQEQPFSVVLFDEIEKAHPAVLNLLLQVFDEGRLTDAAGSVADFRRAVIVMTSNLGARTRATIGFGEDPASAALDVAKAVREHFPPELFNRIDRVVPFAPLTTAAARTIAEKEIARLVGRRGLTERRVFVDVSPSVVDRIVREAFDPRDGARPVKRWVERTIGGALTERIVADKGAALRRYAVFQGPKELVVHGERVEEAEPIAGASPLAPGAPRPSPEALLETLERNLEWLAVDDLPDQLVRLGRPAGEVDGPTAEVLGDLRERYRNIHGELAARVERRHPSARWTEDDIPSRGSRAPAGNMRLFAREQASGKDAQTGGVDYTFGTHALLREASYAGQVDQHSVTVMVARVGHPPWAGRPRAHRAPRPHLAWELTRALMTEFSGVKAVGQAIDGKIDTFNAMPSPSLERTAMHINAPAVVPLLSRLAGGIVLDSLVWGTSLARLHVFPGERDPREVLASHALARKDFVDSVESGKGNIADPDALGRIVLHLRVTAEGHEPVVELLDYVGGHVLTSRLDDALSTVLSLHQTWKDAP